MPGSKVEIKNVETGIVSSATIGDDGAFLLAATEMEAAAKTRAVRRKQSEALQ